MNRFPAIAGVAAGAAWLAWYLSLPGRSVSTLSQEVTGFMGTRTLTASQQSMAAIIAQECSSAGFAWLTVAAVTNAYAESRLDPVAAGDGGESIGLFQLYSRGAGAGMTVAQRQDPRLNTRRILQEVAGPYGAALRAARGSATNAELAAMFARDIERCAACGHSAGDSELTKRAALVAELYGENVAEAVP